MINWITATRREALGFGLQARDLAVGRRYGQLRPLPWLSLARGIGGCGSRCPRIKEGVSD